MKEEINLKQLAKFTKMANEASAKSSLRASELVNAIIALYTTLSSAISLFAFGNSFNECDQKTFLILSLSLSLLIVFLGLLYKYFHMRAPIEVFENISKGTFFSGELVRSIPNKLTDFVVEFGLSIIIVLIFIQLITSFLLVLSKIY
ncbi:hypothetical protein M0R04_03470 [Candidatus Dojkabacteria bacterium]|jgi:hypothetical protein|nr:hypothetical protein [Candidatus Dojkabacteria bacterium]